MIIKKMAFDNQLQVNRLGYISYQNVGFNLYYFK